jgi:DNA-binding MarR family transcriptional regulator
MIVPMKTLEKNDYEIALMVFPIFGRREIMYEFKLVKFYDLEADVLKTKEYKRPLNVEEIAREFGAKPEDVKELLERLGL